MRINDLDKATSNGLELSVGAIEELKKELAPPPDPKQALKQLGMMYMQKVTPAMDEYLEAQIGKAKLDEFKRLTGIIKTGKHKPKAGKNGTT